jgi:hypothetical protein
MSASPPPPPPPPPPAPPSTDAHGIVLATAILFALLFVSLCVFFAWHVILRRRLDEEREDLKSDERSKSIFRSLRFLLKVRVAFYVLATLFAATRVAWAAVGFFAGSSGGDNAVRASFALNRTALALYMGCFSLVLVHGLRRYYAGGSAASLGILRRWQVGVGVTNGVVVLFLVVVLIALAATGDASVAREGHGLFEANILGVAFLNLALGAVFLYYGWQHYQLIKNSGDPDPASERRLLLIGAMTAILFICFVLRCFMFLWRPITDSYLPIGVWYVFAYWVPELIPLGLQTAYVHLSMYEKSKQKSEIGDLYRAHEDSNEHDGGIMLQSPSDDPRASALNSITM